MSMREYDLFAQRHLPGKIPEWPCRDRRRMVGDAIYDFSLDPPGMRWGINVERLRPSDLRGRYALLSEYF